MTESVLRRRLLWLAYLVLLAGVAYLAVRYLFGIAVPFLVAALVAELTRAPIDRLCRCLRLPRKGISFAVVLLTLLLILGICSAVIYGMASVVQDLTEHVPEWMASIQEGLDRLGDRVGDVPEGLAQALENTPSAFFQAVTERLTGWVTDAAGRVPQTALTVGVAVIASFMVCADYHKFGAFLSQVVKPQTVEKWRAVRAVTLAKLRLLVRGYGILLILTFAELSAGFFLLGVPKALAVAAVVALVDILPILGTGTVLIPWAVVALLEGRIAFGIGLLALYAVISAVRSMLEPRVIGTQIQLSPLVVLACMFAGLRLFGFVGLLLFPVAASILKELIKKDLV